MPSSTSTMTQTDRPDVFLFSMARTLSNLFCKLLSEQPGWSYGEYYFHDAYVYWKTEAGAKARKDMSAEEVKRYDDMLDEGLKRMLADRETAKSEGKPMYIKNHLFQIAAPDAIWSDAPKANDPDTSFCLIPEASSGKTNPTFLPDDMVTSFIPIFLIRHPALVVESWYRAEARVQTPDFSPEARGRPPSYELARQLYDWYLARCPEKSAVNKGSGPFHPLVVEADDILEDSTVITRVCELCNMDPDKVPSEWETKPLPENPFMKSFVQGLYNSTSIDKSKSAKGLTLAGKHQAWKEEFGSETADLLHDISKGHMEDYTYLKDLRV